ncbi:MAG TPA: hypothetical protein VE129_07840, partial [Thermoanaerobaculia bacterium]|nr:hypothetical protein [Thermoanaerobaculia bacterium]
SLGNLQTLCKTCNGMKALKELNFHAQQTTRTSPALFKLLETPSGPKTPAVWEMYVKRCLNLFYECRAVESVRIGLRGPSRTDWEVKLFAGNDPKWTKPHLKLLRTRINDIKRKAGQSEVLNILVTAPDTKGVSG